MYRSSLRRAACGRRANPTWFRGLAMNPMWFRGRSAGFPDGGGTTSNRGDVSILVMLITLLVVVLGAVTLTVLSVSALVRSGDIVGSAQALYAADTGIERGLHDYGWSDPLRPTCTRTTAEALPGGSTYALVVQSDSGTCPTLKEIQEGRRALCLEAKGSVRGGVVQRRVTNDVSTSGLTCPQ